MSEEVIFPSSFQEDLEYPGILLRLCCQQSSKRIHKTTLLKIKLFRKIKIHRDHATMLNCSRIQKSREMIYQALSKKVTLMKIRKSKAEEYKKVKIHLNHKSKRHKRKSHQWNSHLWRYNQRKSHQWNSHLRKNHQRMSHQ